MSPLGCFLIVSVTAINVQQARAVCTTPDNFLPYGLSVGDTKVDFYFWTLPVDAIYRVPFNIFGSSVIEIKLQIDLFGFLTLLPQPESASTSGIKVVPRILQSLDMYSQVGHMYFRHSNDSSDMSILNSMKCGPYDGVFIITYACVGEPPLLPTRSYQILVAYDPTKSIVIFNYGSSTGITVREITNLATNNTYPLDEADIADDGITIIDITNPPTQGDGEVLPVETGEPCEVATCSVYADGSVKILNDSTVVNELTLEQSFVATVDQAVKKNNNRPCKFFLMIRTNEANEPIYYVRIGVGVHPKNTKKYLRKFQFSLTNDRFVKEFGNSLSSVKFLYEADLPYAMDDTASAEPLGITVDVTDANDGWIIKSATCGYSFTHLWNNQEPIVTMTLDGDLYDGRIQGTCAGM